MVKVYVGIGSNVDPKRNLALGIEFLRAEAAGFQISQLYEGPAIGVAGDDFVNAVCGFQWSGGFAELTELVRAAHYRAGRAANEQVADGRTLDIDIELFGDAINAHWRVPRRDVLAYDFVLAPLAELEPTLRHPLTGSTMAALWELRAANTALRCLGDYVQP
jgi:2-amino-4-hydroxy-6-hydroxymethyldihydropteridine diphosphokinase